MSQTTCPTCDAPVVYTPAGSNHVVGDWNEEYDFDGERFLREKIAALTGAQLLEIARGAGQAGGLMMQWPSKLRAALLDTLLGTPQEAKP